MKTEAALYTYLASYTGLTDLVGTRIFPVIHEIDAEFPSVVYRRLFSEPVHAMGSDATVRSVVFGFSVLAETYTEVKDVQDQVEAALRGYSGTMGGDGGVVIQSVLLNNIGEDYEDDMRVFVVNLEFELWAEEA